MDETTIRYQCHKGPGCNDAKDETCPACVWVKTRRRTLPKCAKYEDDPAKWIEVFMVDTAEGQRFYHGTWLPGNDGPTLAGQCKPFSTIVGCSGDNPIRVRFYLQREDVIDA